MDRRASTTKNGNGIKRIRSVHTACMWVDFEQTSHGPLNMTDRTVDIITAPSGHTYGRQTHRLPDGKKAIFLFPLRM